MPLIYYQQETNSNIFQQITKKKRSKPFNISVVVNLEPLSECSEWLRRLLQVDEITQIKSSTLIN